MRNFNPARIQLNQSLSPIFFNPIFNPKYQYRQRIYNYLALFETPNQVL